MKTALIDVDGVLAAFLDAALAGFSKRPDQIKTWELFSELPKDEATACRERLNSPYFWAHWVKPYDSAIGFGDRLNNLGYTRIVVLTSPWSQETIPARMEWLVRHFKSQFDAVIFDSEKAHYVGDLFIDDKIENIEKWQKANPKGTALLMDHTYNRSAKHLCRLNGWNDLAAALKRAA